MQELMRCEAETLSGILKRLNARQKYKVNRHYCGENMY